MVAMVIIVYCHRYQGKGYKHARINLIKKGFIERVGASEVTGEEDCAAMEQVKGYRLIKPYTRVLHGEEEEVGPKGGEDDDDDETVYGERGCGDRWEGVW